MSIKLNIFTGQLDFSGTTTAPVSTTDYKVDKITLNSGQIAAKSVTLTSAPTTVTLTRLVPIGGIEADYGVDFQVSGSTLSWNGLGLDGILASGDKLVVVYN